MIVLLKPSGVSVVKHKVVIALNQIKFPLVIFAGLVLIALVSVMDIRIFLKLFMLEIITTSSMVLET